MTSLFRPGATTASILVALACLLVPSVADAWVCAIPGCVHWCGDRAVYSVGASSDDLGPIATDTAVRWGMGDWALVSCSSVAIEHQGDATGRPGFDDGSNVVGWVESSWQHGGMVIGLTTLWWQDETCLSEADIEFNGQDFQWTEAPGLGLTVNAYTIILHEAGHFYGLGHTDKESAVMFPTYDGGIKMLHPDDEEGICSIYSGGPSNACSVAGCPRGQFCLDDVCVAPSGPGITCMPCDTDADCGAEGDMCLQYGDGTYCGRACEVAADCGGGATQCLEVDGGAQQCIRLDANDAPHCDGCRVDAECDTGYCSPIRGVCAPPPARDKELGSPCESNLECVSGLCTVAGGDLVCSDFCDRAVADPCGEGFFCGGNVNLACGVGLCTPGVKGAAASGQDCAKDADCESGTCSSGACVTLCANDTQCGDRLHCQKLPGGCGVCRTNGDIGDPCRGNEQCKAGFCLSDPNLPNSVCSSDCQDDQPCPVGGECRAMGDAHMCLPPVSGLKALGESCITLQECDSGVCVLGGGGQAFCSRSCAAVTDCPSGYQCAGWYCTLAPREAIPTPFIGTGDAGACATVMARPTGGIWPAWLVALALAGLWRRRAASES